jgi:glutathione S-transferase
LYSGTKNASSWAFRAWLALRELGIEFEERVIDIRETQRSANLARIAQFSPPGQVPVLVDEDTVIFDSLAIMEYANDLGGGRLLPAHPKLRGRARALVAWQHSGLLALCAELSFESAFYPHPRPMTADEATQSERIFSLWETELANNGGPYLMGDLSLADLAFVPTIIRLLAHARSVEGWPLTSTWTQRLMARSTVQEWMFEARSLPPVYAGN